MTTTYQHCVPTSSNAIIRLSGFDGFDVRKIDDHEYTVEVSCYFLTKWRDDRLLLHHDILKEKNNPEEQWFPIDLEFVNKVSRREGTEKGGSPVLEFGVAD